MTQASPQETLPDTSLNSLVNRARFSEITQHPGTFESVTPHIHGLVLPSGHWRIPLGYATVVAAMCRSLPAPAPAALRDLRSRLTEYAETDEAYAAIKDAEDAAADMLSEFARSHADIPRATVARALGTTEPAILDWRRNGHIPADSLRFQRSRGRGNGVGYVAATAIFGGVTWSRPTLNNGEPKQILTRWDVLRKQVLGRASTTAP